MWITRCFKNEIGDKNNKELSNNKIRLKKSKNSETTAFSWYN